MGFFQKVGDFLFLPDEPILARKSFTEYRLNDASAETVRELIANDVGGLVATSLSAVHVCARVIAEGLAKPPCYVHKANDRGRTLATAHPLFYLLNASPNDRQTSYEFREHIGWNLALHGNAYVYINRARNGSILEMLALDYGSVSVSIDQTKLYGPISYFVFGRPVDAKDIWHLKGPSALSYEGQSLTIAARTAIQLARNTEDYGANLFKNGAKPSGILAPKAGSPDVTATQAAEIKAQWNAQAAGVGNAHKTIMMTHGLQFTPMAGTANDAQWIEARKMQIEEICRFFRVSPTKAFLSNGSQSYASVEQGHIAHDEDTDAHWHERFMQSANKHLLSDRDRRAGFTVSIDSRSIMRGTMQERMAYITAGKAAGVLTTNECREIEGYDLSNDPADDRLTPAANLFGPQPPIGEGE